MNPQNGKGSKPRKERDDKAYGDNWEKIFGKKNINRRKEKES